MDETGNHFEPSGFEEAEAEAARQRAQEAARESGAPVLDLDVGDELDLNVSTEAAPEIQVNRVAAPGERDYLTLMVGGEERARTFCDEIAPEVFEAAAAESDPRKQAALIWPAEPGQPDAGSVQPGEQTAAEGLAEQVEKASGTVYVLFRHGVTLADLPGPMWEAGIAVKLLGGGEQELEPLSPIGVGRFAGAPAALLACRERFGEGDYAAIPLRNITVKAWKQEQVAKWV